MLQTKSAVSFTDPIVRGVHFTQAVLRQNTPSCRNCSESTKGNSIFLQESLARLEKTDQAKMGASRLEPNLQFEHLYILNRKIAAQRAKPPFC